MTRTSPGFKVYSQHNCTRTHRTYHSLAKCMFPTAAWIIGEGPYASVSWCRVITVILHDNPTAATGSKTEIDNTGCGGHCHNRHEIIQLSYGPTWTTG